MTDRELMQQALDALELACETADRVPNRWHETEAPGTAAYDIGVAINQRNLSGECGYHVLNDAASALRARLAEPVQPVAVPDGWALVPVEPTTEMLGCIVRRKYPEDWDAGKLLQARQRGDGRVPFKTEYEMAVGQYERMLAAAPKGGAS